jgi:phosphatidylethanolamine-binding protein (PEBP) family uncharacterized protein
MDQQRLPPKVRIERDAASPYMSLFVYDIDAPFPCSRKTSPFLHFLRANVACTAEAWERLRARGQTSGSMLLGYVPPNPSNGLAHCYRFEVVGHTKPVDEATLVGKARERFPVREFQVTHGMNVLQRRFFMCSGQNKATPADDTSAHA